VPNTASRMLPKKDFLRLPGFAVDAASACLLFLPLALEDPIATVLVEDCWAETGSGWLEEESATGFVV